MFAIRSPFAVASLAISATLFSIPATAQFAKPDDAVKYRQSSMFVMSNHMGRLGAMARGDRPFDAAAAQYSARVVETLSRAAWDGFAKGADSKRAKSEIWSSDADFKAQQDKLMAETGKLVEAAAGLDTLKRQAGAVGAACKSCHDKFRND